MNATQPAGLSQDAILTISLWVLGLGTLIVLVIVLFALALLSARHLRWWRMKQPYPLEMLFHDLANALHDPGRHRSALAVGAVAATVYGEYLSRRNEFWTTYGQVTIAVLLLIVVTILLLTKTIDPDAGLPILSGVAGFAIAKGTNAPAGIAPRLPERGEGPQ
jgi:uncharacterized membrane protein YhaH (DUF805 family)